MGDAGPLRLDEAAGTAVLEGADLQLSEKGATVLGQALGVGALSPALEVGTARVTTGLPAS